MIRRDVQAIRVEPVEEYHDLIVLARSDSSGVRLLGALRIWRVARVMNTLLLSADEAHEETRDTLRMAEKV